jgi:hypothetical protein
VTRRENGLAPLSRVFAFHEPVTEGGMTGCTLVVFVINYLLAHEAICRELSRSRPKFIICNECVVDYLVVDLICHF